MATVAIVAAGPLDESGVPKLTKGSFDSRVETDINAGKTVFVRFFMTGMNMYFFCIRVGGFFVTYIYYQISPPG